MIKNIKYRLLCLKKNNINIIAVFLSIILIFEIYCYYSMKYLEQDNENEKYESQSLDSKTELKDVVNDLCQKNLEILSIEKVEKSYNIEVSIKGNKEDISNVFKTLNNYKIIDFEFDIDNNSLKGKVCLCSK